MRFTSVPLSALLHGAVVAALMVGLWPQRKPDTRYIPPVPIEVISKAELAAQTSVPEMTRTEEPPEEEPAAEETPPEETPAPAEESPPPLQEEETPPPPVEDPPPPADETPPEADEPQEEETPPPPEDDTPPPPADDPPPPEENEDDFDLGDLNDALKDLDPDKQPNKPNVVDPDAASGDRNQEQIGQGDRLSVSEEVLLAACVRQRYRLDKSAQNWEQFVIEIGVRLNIDGSLSGPVEILNEREINRSGSAAYQAAARNAVAAITGCFPLDGLDPARYSSWDAFSYRFRPQDF